MPSRCQAHSQDGRLRFRGRPRRRSETERAILSRLLECASWATIGKHHENGPMTELINVIQTNLNDAREAEGGVP